MFLSVHQVAETLLMLQCGILIGFLYNLFSPFRRLGARWAPALFLADFLFAVLSGALFVAFLLLASQGELHFYAFPSAGLGILLQYLSMRPIIKAIRRKRIQKQMLQEQTDGKTQEI